MNKKKRQQTTYINEREKWPIGETTAFSATATVYVSRHYFQYTVAHLWCFVSVTLSTALHRWIWERSKQTVELSAHGKRQVLTNDKFYNLGSFSATSVKAQADCFIFRAWVQFIGAQKQNGLDCKRRNLKRKSCNSVHWRDQKNRNWRTFALPVLQYFSEREREKERACIAAH